MKDDAFERPKAIVNMKIYTGDADFGKTSAGRVFANVWKNVTTEYLREFSYMAECANLEFEITLLHNNVDFKWSGFNDSMPNFIQETIKRIKNL